MSLAVVFKSPEGLVLAADSRVTVMGQVPVVPVLPPNSPTPAQPFVTVQMLPSYYDNATKLLAVNSQSHIGMVTYGAGALGQREPRTAYSYMPEFEEHLANEGSGRRSVLELSRQIGIFFQDKWTAAGMPVAPLPPGVEALNFLIAGFNEGETYGRVYLVVVPDAIDPVEQKAGDFGITWGGQSEFLQRLLNGFAPQAADIAKATLGLDDAQERQLVNAWNLQMGLPIPYQFLPLQDCLDMADFLVNVTSSIQTWMVAVRGVGGEIDLATITRTDGLRPVRQKEIHAY